MRGRFGVRFLEVSVSKLKGSDTEVTVTSSKISVIYILTLIASLAMRLSVSLEAKLGTFRMQEQQVCGQLQNI